MTETVYVGLGSNLEAPRQQVIKAFVALSSMPKSLLVAQSSLYLSLPMGPQDQENYVNAVAKLTTELKPIELLDQLQMIENLQGRIRGAKQWGPRTLDLDLLLYGNQVISNKRLTVPHYGLKQRSFVLIPLAEIEPQICLPDKNQISDLIRKLGSQGIQKL